MFLNRLERYQTEMVIQEQQNIFHNRKNPSKIFAGKCSDDIIADLRNLLQQ